MKYSLIVRKYKRGFILAPQIFQVVLNLVIPLMDPLTKDSLRVFGRNRKNWMPVVREQIDPDQLPRRYGGDLE